MRHISILILCILTLQLSYSQSPSDKIDPNNINFKYLEHLTKVKIDSVRKDHGLKPLANDSILYVAAQGHAQYLTDKNLLSHFEEDIPEKRTPQDRAEYHGASKDYGVGENVLSLPILEPIQYKHLKGKDKPHTIQTYDQAANDMVIGWVNSPPHYANMITPGYEVTGLAVIYHPERKEFKGVQKFATIQWIYEFDNTSPFFPYAKPLNIPTYNSFEEIPRPDKLPKKYAWKLKPPKTLPAQEDKHCKICFDEMQENKSISRLEEGDQVMFYTEDVEFARKVFKRRKDGAALEVIRYTPFDCGNPEYYSMPSRRNGLNLFNGPVQPPVFKKDIFSAWKEQKKSFKKEKKTRIKTAKANGLPKEEIRAIKDEEWNPDYLKFPLGYLPKDVNEMYELNFILIKKKRVCRVLHFPSYCGEPYEEKAAVNYLHTLKKGKFKLPPIQETRTVSFTVPFEKNVVDFDYDDIKPFMDSLQVGTQKIESIDILAYASVEGDSIINEDLQRKRAISLVRALRTYNVSETIDINIETATNWDLMYDQLDGSNYDEWKDQSHAQILELLSIPVVEKQFEPWLAKQRKGIVRLRIQVDQPQENVDERTLDALQKEITLSLSIKDDSIARTHVEQGKIIQNHIFQQVKSAAFSQEMIERMVIPTEPITRDLVLNEMFMEDTLGIGMEDTAAYQEAFYDRLKDLAEMRDEDGFARFNQLAFLINNWDDELYDPAFNAYELELRIRDLLQQGVEGANFQDLLLTYYFQAAKYFYPEDRKRLMRAVSYVFDYYKTKELDEETALNLASFYVWAEAPMYAYQTLAPFVEREEPNHEILSLFLKIVYIHPDETINKDYTKLLIGTSNYLTEEEWCSLFVGGCNISFQIFDHEPLRKLYCEKCEELRKK